MDLGLTQQQEILRTSAREFLDAECPTTLVREAESSAAGHSPELWRKMADLGWLGMGVPEAYGGLGASLSDQAVLHEELGRALAPGPLLASSVLSAQVLALAGSDTQKDLSLIHI